MRNSRLRDNTVCFPCRLSEAELVMLDYSCGVQSHVADFFVNCYKWWLQRYVGSNNNEEEEECNQIFII